jgi:hypothetical protein
VLVALAGCASAVREPPPVEAIGGQTGPALTEPTEASGVDALLAEAAAEFARRPDPARASRARELYLSAARADATRTEGLLGAARVGAWLIEHEADAARREALAVEDVQLCQWCDRLASTDPECDYRLAIAIGQQARERPTTALDALPRMVRLLRDVAATAPSLDFAGPHRVLALVLLRAPGWPSGPGDPEEGLAEARRAVTLAPDYPPNQLAHAEALAANSQDGAARAAWEDALRLATTGGASRDPDALDWASEARRGLAPLPDREPTHQR